MLDRRADTTYAYDYHATGADGAHSADASIALLQASAYVVEARLQDAVPMSALEVDIKASCPDVPELFACQRRTVCFQYFRQTQSAHSPESGNASVYRAEGTPKSSRACVVTSVSAVSSDQACAMLHSSFVRPDAPKNHQLYNSLKSLPSAIC